MSSGDWEKVDTAEFLRDVARAETEPYRLEGHSWGKMRRVPWLRCRKCGLLGLRNQLTAWCERMGCLHARHPEYRSRVRSAAARPAGAT